MYVAGQTDQNKCIIRANNIQFLSLMYCDYFGITAFQIFTTQYNSKFGFVIY